ncbi:TLD family protein [Trichomonas vaginalis G3]|uniref:Oxidation resistance protein 1 n=1 Tax=Trichomonas vaginalis (strain ATCC PRA-98 / G3) TaxID=412133 RepID=A2FPN9_TRIV3|nr:negative regulation of peptidyl-cysteine S-nitrosylation [Trichomonas vaginalis G3]EAX93115.1 TLD family protein [Trichomonas vaginalis G3]KAI5514076.1 negative regulation of peptidyl-cysteine S-nitrosylation [Trichomonas vaginalis G3]|eukprot:XP_001306045.1 TLD family protein [Trichomonas vaginalis G3]
MITVFEVAEQSRTSLLIMKADNGIRLGCFLPQGLKYSSKVYGSGDIFVFNFAPELNCFKWSRKNSNFITATNTEVMIGAGKEGGAAIYFTKFMDNGWSDFCETFSSPPLALREDFHILDLEIWDISYKQTSIVKKNG